MQRKFVALAAIAFCGAASAQSSVTLFGVVDASAASVKTNTGRITGMSNSGGSTSKLGFKGVEDLGDGLTAGFWMEMGFNPDAGTGTSGTSVNNQVGGVGAGALQFSRRATVSLSGPFGEIRLGRDFVPSYHALGWNDVVMYGNGVGAGLVQWGLFTQTMFRASNMIQYHAPGNLGGFYGKVGYAFGERASTETFTGTAPAYAVGRSTKENGTYYGGTIGWKGGPADVAAGWGRTKFAAGTATTSAMGLAAVPIGDFTEWSLGGSYNVIPGLQIRGVYVNQEANDAGALGNELETKSWVIGPSWTVGAHTLMASYSRLKMTSGLLATEPEARKWALGYKYNLSKRTYVYAAYGRVSNSGGSAQTSASASSGGLGAVSGPANVNGKSTGTEFGLAHSF